ncbi:MAG: GNAT family N-acetyltransferase [Sphingopyxis sp.]|uniref:GNAT family N-acetyltransferase n=1 Tax=Sphingopyxis sp. TaxID=1908224 RepID=UPI002AB99A16|nr:GNAT family N-acetyltransferase [Sphingopyxis sp.]MDZ3833516.1 GNAT family N-acetyltransferase [Sphingopyxis sp.]
MSAPLPPRDAEISFRRITALNVCDVCDLSRTLSAEQRGVVADNGTSIAEGFCSQNAWFRAIHADETLIGFVMLHKGYDWDDGIECPGVYLWRFMIAGPFQKRGYGRRAIAMIIEHLKVEGWHELYTSFGLGAGSPQDFYLGMGFELTGDTYDEELEAVLRFGA